MMGGAPGGQPGSPQGIPPLAESGQENESLAEADAGDELAHHEAPDLEPEPGDEPDAGNSEPTDHEQ